MELNDLMNPLTAWLAISLSGVLSDMVVLHRDPAWRKVVMAGWWLLAAGAAVWLVLGVAGMNAGILTGVVAGFIATAVGRIIATITSEIILRGLLWRAAIMRRLEIQLWLDQRQ
jgi:hypothetical protein